MKTSLTTWEAKERAGLLALETEEWREKRLIAEAPYTTADVLERLASEIEASWRMQSDEAEARETQNYLLVKAITAHPNTPLVSLLNLLSSESGTFQSRKMVYILGSGGYMPIANFPSPAHVAAAAGISINPVAPFLCLETPDFWTRICRPTCLMALSQASLPFQVAHQISCMLTPTTIIPESAQLHVSIAGEIQTQSEGKEVLTKFWQAFCQKECEDTTHGYRVSQHSRLVKYGFAPCWALGKPLKYTQSPLRSSTLKRNKVKMCLLLDRFGLQRARNFLFRAMVRNFYHEPFTDFVEVLYGAGYLPFLRKRGTSDDWKERLCAAMGLPMTGEPFTEDRWNRSPLDLMHYLAHDGNRFVRWAAQTRLADPNFVFTWHNGSE